MIPKINNFTELELETLPSKNYRIVIKEHVVNGTCDELEAMKQVVFKILQTERYDTLIYSWNYGIELKDLFGEPMSYVCPELERRITEALIQDDRIESVEDFAFDISKRSILVTFTVHTIFGSFKQESEVAV